MYAVTIQLVAELSVASTSNLGTLLVAGAESNEGALHVKSMKLIQKGYSSQTASDNGSIVSGMRVRLYEATGTEKINLTLQRNLILRVPFTHKNIFIATGN